MLRRKETRDIRAEAERQLGSRLAGEAGSGKHKEVTDEEESDWITL